METNAIKLIRQLVRLTRAGKIKWCKIVNEDKWDATVNDVKFEVEFICLMRTDETGSDRTIARFTAFGVVRDYAIGTEGWELLCETISIHDEFWKTWRQGCDRRLREGMAFLRRLKRTR